jgi:polygalacturonase
MTDRSMHTTRAALSILSILLAMPVAATEFNVRDHGAKGDGKTIDSLAINAAIEAAASQGGGTVVLPPGTYLSFSIRLKSLVTLRLDAGATLRAATPAAGVGEYDPPEPNEWGDRLQYQDFGHSHWHNSLIWAEDVHDVAIVGQGLIDGTALLREAGYSATAAAAGPNGTIPPSAMKTTGARAAAMPSGTLNQGNKAIAFKNARNVTIRGISVLRGGHFAILASGVDGLTLQDLTVDTNRDGLDIDASRNVRIENCKVNSPHDDAIVLKSSYALGALRATENVSITNCSVTGFDIGTLLDGTRGRTTLKAPDQDGPTGRIKIGTESNGAFRNVRISNCAFERSRGLALETVDGGVIEDVTIDNIRMRDINNPVVLLRIGNRARGPARTPIGTIRRVKISHIEAEDVDSRYASILLVGLPGHPIEDVQLSDIAIAARGGLTPEIVAQQPSNLVNAFFLDGKEAGVLGPRDPFAVPERPRAYPEPSMFGLLPSSVVYARHVRDLGIQRLRVSFAQPDARLRTVLEDVSNARLGE